MRRRLDDIKISRESSPWRRSYNFTKMKVQDFKACVILHRLADLFDFSSEDKKFLHKKTYENFGNAHYQVDQFKRYLKSMEKRISQKIPREQLKEYFGGKQEKDVIMSGNIFNILTFF